MTAPGRPEPVDGLGSAGTPADAEPPVDPWAPGGSMSVGWVDERASVTSGPDAEVDGFRARTQVDTPATATRHPLIAVGAAAVVGVAAVVGLVAVRSHDAVPDVSADVTSPSGIAPSIVAPSIVAPRSDAEIAIAQVGTEAHSVVTIAGTISWARIDGDASTLPQRVIRADGGELLGVDDEGARWRSVDGGVTWATVDRMLVFREIGGVVWSSRFAERTVESWNSVDGAEPRPTVVDVAGDAGGDGYTVQVELPADGFPTELGDAIFLPVTVRTTVSWWSFDDVEVGRPYRYEVDFDGRPVRAVSGVFHEMPVTRFGMREVEPGRFELTDARGASVWTFATPGGDLAPTPADLVSGVATSVWTRWNGERFVRADAPWQFGDRVEFAETPEAMLALVTAPGRKPAIWRTTDGLVWATVSLPTEPRDGMPLDVRQGDGEATVTAFTDGGSVSWATVDGAQFLELTSVPGADSRAKGSFGWIAPSPRNAPQLHISPDGEMWEFVDLRDLLDLDGSRWSVTIEATPVGDDIFVIADGSSGRTLLIGTVAQTP